MGIAGEKWQTVELGPLQLRLTSAIAVQKLPLWSSETDKASSVRPTSSWEEGVFGGFCCVAWRVPTLQCTFALDSLAGIPG